MIKIVLSIICFALAFLITTFLTEEIGLGMAIFILGAFIGYALISSDKDKWQ